MMSHAKLKTTVIVLFFMFLVLLLGAGDALAGEVAKDAVSSPTGVTNTNLWAPTLRMIMGLGGVLALLGILAFAMKRLRRGNAFKSGMIEIVSGVSLGGREKVVLLRVGGDEVLVGMSPSGMRPLHVVRHAETKRAEPAEFDTYMGTFES